MYINKNGYVNTIVLDCPSELGCPRLEVIHDNLLFCEDQRSAFLTESFKQKRNKGIEEATWKTSKEKRPSKKL